jgi:excisionase family DNA binding protein
MADGGDGRPQGETRLLNVREAAKYLGTTPKTLYSKAWRHQIAHVKIGRSLRFDIRELDRLIQESTVKPQELSARLDRPGEEF